MHLIAVNLSVSSVNWQIYSPEPAYFSDCCSISQGVDTNTGPLTHKQKLDLGWSRPSIPCSLQLAEPLLISLTTLAIYSTVSINHPSPLLSPPLYPSPTSSSFFASLIASVLLSFVVCCSSICARAAVMR